MTDRGQAVWVDANAHARTHAIARRHRRDRVLGWLRVTRPSNPRRQYAAVDESVPDTAATLKELTLIVAPTLDAPYRDDSLCRDSRRGRLRHGRGRRERSVTKPSGPLENPPPIQPSRTSSGATRDSERTSSRGVDPGRFGPARLDPTPRTARSRRRSRCRLRRAGGRGRRRSGPGGSRSPRRPSRSRRGRVRGRPRTYRPPGA